MDIGSSYAASRVVNLVKGATKSMVIDFGVLVEGKADDELPERLIGACFLQHATVNPVLIPTPCFLSSIPQASRQEVVQTGPGQHKTWPQGRRRAAHRCVQFGAPTLTITLTLTSSRILTLLFP